MITEAEQPTIVEKLDSGVVIKKKKIIKKTRKGSYKLKNVIIFYYMHT